MKNKLLTSILAAMLVLVAGVSAFEVAVDTSVDMTEDTLETVVMEFSDFEENETITAVTCTGDHLTIGAAVDAEDETKWNLDITPAANWDEDTTFSCTIESEIDGVPSGDVVKDFTVAMTPVNDAPTITAISDKELVVDDDFTYDAEATDIDSETLTFSVDGPTGMEINPATGLITWTPDDDQTGKRTVVVQVSDGELTASEEFTIDVRPKKICKYGEVGDIYIDEVNNPDDGDEFKAGDEMDIEVRVGNDGEDNMDITVKAMLYDIDEGKLLASVTSDETRIKDGEEENFDLTLIIPTTDWDADNNFVLYISAYEDEDENCAYEQVPITLEREDDDVIVKELTLTPEETKTGKTVTATVTVANIGEDDQSNVYVKLRNSYLDLKEESESFDLDDYKHDDSEHTVTFTFEVPEDAEAKEYWIEAVVLFDKETGEDSEIASLTVTGEGAEEPEADTETPSLEIVPGASLSAETGKQVAVPVVINNAGNTKASFTLEVSSTEGWAEVMAIEQPDSLNAGESGHAYIYLEIREDAAIGVHEFSLNVRNEDGLLATKKVGVTVEGQAAADAPVEEPTGNKITGMLTAGSTAVKAFYTAGAIVLVLVGLFFLRMLFKK